MSVSFVLAGILCLVASAAGAGVKAAGFEIEAIRSSRRQLLVAMLGVLLIGLGWIASATEGSGEPAGRGPDVATTEDGESSPASSVDAPTGVARPGPGEVAPATELQPVDVTATSELPADSRNSYAPGNLLDGDPSTAWCEGVDGNGVGEGVVFAFRQEVALTEVHAMTGYAKPGRFFANARPRAVVAVGGAAAVRAELADTTGWQSLPVTDSRTARYELLIESAYDGTDHADLCLSEVRFVGTPR